MKLLVIGATSNIAMRYLEMTSKSFKEIVLVVRNEDKLLNFLSQNLELKKKSIIKILDFSDPQSIKKLNDHLTEKSFTPNEVFITIGASVLTLNEKNEFSALEKLSYINYLSPMYIIESLYEWLKSLI